MKTILNSLLILAMLWVGSSHAIIVEAEDATIKTTGGPIDGGWNLWSNGTIGEYFHIKAAGVYEVKVYASGSSLEGISPIRTLSVDGLARETTIIDTSEFTDYVVLKNDFYLMLSTVFL